MEELCPGEVSVVGGRLQPSAAVPSSAPCHCPVGPPSQQPQPPPGVETEVLEGNDFDDPDYFPEQGKFLSVEHVDPS
ncbi:hypothetical protein GUJ93_ZPchr0006g41222 [Zizania palustris]|uniref:Uncharacterized protein n=1 Tax=Zizania palustris TaxID=103762 RepID=A0A8J5SWZ4_ZIZPA|nr:hypothetical protein GUJ93_ZPchr0006g41222 [Zizania palustris]